MTALRWLPLLLALLTVSGQAVPVLEGRTLSFEDGPRVVWQRTYPAAMGDLSGPLQVGSVTYLGAGPSVYALSSAGSVLGRADLPGLVTSIDASGGAVLVTTQEGSLTERYTLDTTDGLDVRERVVLPPDIRVTGWLARVADTMPAALLAQAVRADPTNPFLALREAHAAQADPYRALNRVRRALAGPLPFPAWVQLAARLDRDGYPAAADLALGRALKDAAARGLDPELSVSRAALSAYGNPSGYVGTLLAQNRLARADVWMRYLRDLHPRFEGGPALYERYARVLDTQGRSGEAEQWRQFTRSLNAGTLYNLGPQGLRSVRDAARLVTLTLALALVAALLAFQARAWTTQSADTAPLGGRWRSWLRHPLARARRVTVAYTSLGERLLLALLAAALVTGLAGWQWANQASAALHAPALNLGTYGGGWSGAQLADLNLRPGPDAALLAGLAAHLDGDDGAARDAYTRALPDACAQNNLGVIAQGRGDEAQARDRYRAALSARPDLAAPAFNLGLNPATPSATFQRTYRPGQPRLCYPDERSLTRAVTGDLSVTLGGLLRSPQDLFTAGAGRSVRLGTVLSGAILLSALLILSLLLPRATLALRRSRPFAYRALGLLLPGTTLLDSAWGGVLLLAWSAAVAALAPRSGLVSFPDLPTLTGAGGQAAVLGALVVTYALNTLVFVGAEVRHARRVRRDAPAPARS
ncbi:hypothetical protein E7T09_12290 [Deinococcus sp. KSM4-11]|uniref:hypothetical protein n=1 Tax=Deinococcus sp. KSM4-11 TaxID=2568654 RepID=UPI0010A44379|nr:hypothetical protein [Deinococcus sp. KSM4-11]THF86021.1 hypothetical protein E7T09_12290 [Deinococcus sp. KSM4-11]